MEIEIKLRLSSRLPAVRRKLRDAGFRISERRMLETNIIFDDAHSTLAGQGKLIRLRRVGGQGILTYKGPAQPSRHKKRPEIEIDIPDPDVLQEIIELIGFHPVFRYEKYRTVYSAGSKDGEIMLDETPIGNFMELEGKSRWIDATARMLGFSNADYVLDSYGRLYLEYCRERGMTPKDMTFSVRRKKPQLPRSKSS
jgi:adenylate cyclase, class 2